MNPTDIPPLLEPEPAPRPKWRWGVHLGLLIVYVLAMGLLGAVLRNPGASVSQPVEAAMPKTLRGLVIMCVAEFSFFAILFALAWIFSRARIKELFLNWRGGLRPILWGFVYSIGLRVAIMLITALLVAPLFMLKGEKNVEKLRPKVESLVNPDTLKDPAYLLFTLTFLSFGLAGFREELWRAGVMAGLAGIAPAVFKSRKGQIAAVLIAATVFGLGHLPQGWGGVILTAMLGIGLGLIIVREGSIWAAVFAHGFFDATSFAMLALVVNFAPEALRAFGISPQ